jgi:hypothetical protein
VGRQSLDRLPILPTYEKLEAEQSKNTSNHREFQPGYVEWLPPEYQGPKHLVERDRIPCNILGGVLFEWEEVEGPATNEEEDESTTVVIRLQFAAPEPYHVGDARRRIEAEAQQGSVEEQSDGADSVMQRVRWMTGHEKTRKIDPKITWPIQNTSN